MRSTPSALALALASLLATASVPGSLAFGAPAEVHFTGTVFEQDVLPGMTLPASLGLGRTISGRVTLDASDAHLLGGDAGRALYDFPSRNISAVATAGADSLATGPDPISRSLSIEVINAASPGPGDALTLNCLFLAHTLGIPDHDFGAELVITLTDPSGAAFDDLNIPARPLTEQAFAQRLGALYFASLSSPGQGSSAAFTIDTLLYVPAPGATAAALAGATLISLRRRRMAPC